MTTAEAYVTAAFLVVLAVVLLWLVIYAFKMRRLESEVNELERAQPEQRERVGVPRVVPGPGAAADTSGESAAEGQPAESASQPAEPVR